MVNPDGKVVVVTGASSGIGAALARLFSEKGARVVLTSRRRDRLEETAARCSGETLVLPADLVEDAHRKALVDQTVKRWGRIDILANNAGLGIYGDFSSTTEAQWRQLFEINLFSIVFLTRGVLPVMKAQEGRADRQYGFHRWAHGPFRPCDPLRGQQTRGGGIFPGPGHGSERDRDQGAGRLSPPDGHRIFSSLSRSGGYGARRGEIQNIHGHPEDVARGIVRQLDSERLVVFPTEKPARAYEKQRDL